MKIKELTLFSSNLQNQKQFYKDVLEFELLLDTPEIISFKAGDSILTFQYKEEIQPSHVAFNIPSHSIHEALKWLKKRTVVYNSNDQYIIDFPAWEAKSIYFNDADNNIMEFISRTRLDIKGDREFSPKSIISIGEMAIATHDIESIYNSINALKPIPIFDGDFSRFCALGNDEGLFILIDKNVKKWYPTNDDAFTSDFIIKGDYNFSFIDGKLKKYCILETLKQS